MRLRRDGKGSSPGRAGSGRRGIGGVPAAGSFQSEGDLGASGGGGGMGNRREREKREREARKVEEGGERRVATQARVWWYSLNVGPEDTCRVARSLILFVGKIRSRIGGPISCE
jgi:hypothetical protein